MSYVSQFTFSSQCLHLNRILRKEGYITIREERGLELLDAGPWTGNIVALPNNRVRVTHPAWFETGTGAPDFKPSAHIHYSKSDLDYTLDVNRIFNNLYAEDE